MNRTKEYDVAFLELISYRGIRETIPAVIELNISLKRVFNFPRYQAIANSNICKTRNNRIA
jgi:hypothetical protein